MKRLLAMLLTLCLFWLSACSALIPEPETEEETMTKETAAPTAETVETDDGYVYPTFGELVGREELDAIPVARPGMSEDQLRSICLEYMTLQAKITWTANKDFSYSCPGAGAADAAGLLHFKRGVRYHGMPYNSAAGDIASLLDYVDPETGLLAVPGDGSSIPSLFGNNCATDLFWAWARISTTDAHYGTQNMTPANGIVILGNLDYDVKGGNYQTVSTQEICMKNGAQRMFRAYAGMKPADGFVGFITGGNHHAMMLMETPTVVKNSDGTIDGKESFVYIVEETSTQVGTGMTASGESFTQLGGLHKKMTFNQLFNSIYLPISCRELQGLQPIEEARVELDLPAAVSLSDLTKAQISSNYAISRIDVKVLNADGSVAHESFNRGMAKESPRTVAVLRSGFGTVLRRNMEPGEYGLRISVRLGNGETREVYQGTLTV